MIHKPVLVQLVQHLQVGGLETMALTLAQQLSAQFDVHLVSLEGDEDSLRANWSKLELFPKVHGLSKPEGVSVSTISNLRNYLVTHRARYLHSHHLGPLLYGGAACVGLKIGHLHTHHDGWSLERGNQAKLTRWAVNLFNPVSVADADSVAEQCQRMGVRVDEVIANGVDLSHFRFGDKLLARDALALPLDTKILGCVCRLESVKAIDHLIQALAELPANVHLALAGGGSQRRGLEQMVQQLGLEQRVHFLGHIDDPSLVYHALDLFCLVSHNEGAPMSLIEAQACGVRCMVNDVGHCRSLLHPTQGVLLANNQPRTIAQGVISAFSEPAKVSVMAQQLRSFAIEVGDGERMANRYRLYLQGNAS